MKLRHIGYGPAPLLLVHFLASDAHETFGQSEKLGTVGYAAPARFSNNDKGKHRHLYQGDRAGRKFISNASF